MGDEEKRARPRASRSASRSSRPSSASAEERGREEGRPGQAAAKASEKDVEEIRERAQFELDFLKSVYDTIRTLKPKQLIDDERVWRELQDRYADYFSGGMGAEAVKDLIARLDLEAEESALKEVIATAKGQRKAKAIKRLKVISAFNRATTTTARSTRRWAWCSTRSR